MENTARKTLKKLLIYKSKDIKKNKDHTGIFHI